MSIANNMSYTRVRRSLSALACSAALILGSLTFCSRRTDWVRGDGSIFNPDYYNKARGAFMDCDGNLLASTITERKVNSKGKEINKNRNIRVYHAGPEYFNVIGCVTTLQKRTVDKETGELVPVKGVYETKGPEGGERVFAKFVMGSDDPTAPIGGSIVFTVNSAVQKRAYDALVSFSNKWHDKQNADKAEGDKTDYCSKGAAVVMDIQTGALIAYTDIPSPSYDDLSKLKYADQFIDLKDGNNPDVFIKEGMLYDYCNALNTPGSTFKVLSASILVDAGAMHADTKVREKGVFEYNISENGKYSMKLYDHDAKYDSKAKKRIPVDKGYVTAKTCLIDSLNVGFAEFAQLADRNQYRKIAHDTWHMNVGYRIEEDDPSYQDTSRIPTDFGGIRRPQVIVDNNQLYFDSSYGHGETLISAIFTTMVTGAVASDTGDLMRPYMVKTYLNANGKEVSYKKASGGLRQGDVLTKGAVSREAHDIITDAMRNHEKAKNKAGLGIKTGTAKLTNKSNISMTGFVEDRSGKPRYAITICMFEMRKSTLGGGSLAPAFYAIADELRKLPDM